MRSSAAPVNKAPQQRLAFGVLTAIAITKFLFHLVVNATTAYGYFRDEYYYIACSERLAWGYVDQPPLSLAILKLSSLLFGESLWAIRIFPALAGAGVIFITGLMVMKLGGKCFEVVLASVAVFIAPIFLAMNGYYSMNSFDHLFWIGAVYVIILILEKSTLKLWIILGVVLGLGLMNKISVLWLGAGLFMGLILTQHRRLLLTKAPYLASFIAFILFLPYILWQQANDWPLVAFITNASSEKYVEKSVLSFVGDVILTIHPFNFLLWLIGLVYFLFHQEGKKYRLVGIIFVTVFLILASNATSKSEYFAPAFPMLFAGGAVLVGKWLKGRSVWIKRLPVVVLILGGVLTAPLVVPLLPVEEYMVYARALGEAPATSEKKEIGALPQFYADMHGWENMAIEVSRVYQSLSDEEQENSVVFGQNYGEAGAIEFYQRKYPLPRAISGHNNYWLWGPGETSKDVVFIIIGSNLEDNSKFFEEVEQRGKVISKYAMPYESNLPVFVGRKPKRPIEEFWPMWKHYD